MPLDVPGNSLVYGPELAHGSESTVFKGQYMDTTVAIKKPRIATSEDMDNFHRELQLVIKLHHGAIAKLVGARAFPPDYSFLFKLYEGGSLADALHLHEWKPSAFKVVTIAIQLADALNFIHSNGVVHRDVKPANILLDQNGGAFLTDFGLASEVSSLELATEDNWKSSGKPTGGFHKKHMVGTLPYMAPEVLAKELHTDKSDVYSFAVSINEVATGVIPYSDRQTDPQAHTVLEMKYSQQQLAAAISSGLRPVLMGPETCAPPVLAELLKRCWQDSPQGRPPMAQVLKELHKILADLGKGPGLDSGITGGADSDSPEARANSAVFRETKPGAVAPIPSPPQAPPHSSTTSCAPTPGEDSSIAAHGAARLGALVSLGDYTPQVSCGAFETQGGRASMEDRHFLLQCFGAAPNVHLFGVFDGHRGPEAAEYAKLALPKMLEVELQTLGPEAALKASFLKVDKAFRDGLDGERRIQKSRSHGWHPGCTATVALLFQSRLLVANAGDCRALLCRKGQPVALSRDHLASNAEERARVAEAGGSVQWRVNTWRVGEAAIEVTRSIGDDDLKPAVTAEPEVTAVTLTEGDEFLIIASDGLWETVSNENALRLVYDTVKEPSMCAKRLATEAVDKGSRDNITVAVIYLTPVSTLERVY